MKLFFKELQLSFLKQSSEQHTYYDVQQSSIFLFFTMNTMIEPPQLTRLKEVIVNIARISAVLGKKKLFCNLFGFQLEDYLKERDIIADQLRHLGGAILKKLYKNVEGKIEALSLNNEQFSVQFLGGILSIDGVFVPPFSKKQDLNLTLAGKPAFVFQTANLLTSTESQIDEFKEKLQQIGTKIQELKFKQDTVNGLLSELNSCIFEVRKSIHFSWVQKYLFNYDLLMKDLGYRMGYCLDYKGNKLFQGQKMMNFLSHIISIIHTDVYSQKGFISGFSPTAISIFKRISIVLEASTDKILGQLFRAFGISLENWSPLPQSKQKITSQEAAIVTHTSYKYDAYTREYDDIVTRLRRICDEPLLNRKHLCYLICKHSGKVIDFSEKNNSKIHQWQFQSTSNQRLYISGGKFVTIQDEESERCVTASSVNIEITKQPFGGSMSQYFHLESASDRNPHEYFIETAIFERVFDVYMKQKDNEVKIIHWPRHRGNNQTWYIHRV